MKLLSQVMVAQMFRPKLNKPNQLIRIAAYNIATNTQNTVLCYSLGKKNHLVQVHLCTTDYDQILHTRYQAYREKEMWQTSGELMASTVCFV